MADYRTRNPGLTKSELIAKILREFEEVGDAMRYLNTKGAPAPELAGQRYQYIENQLLDFHNHVRDNPLSQQYMWGAAANLNAQTARDLAIYFSTLPPKSANDGIPQLADIGREIYFEGVPEFNIVPCAACHGPNAEGIRNIPSSAGRSYAYLKRRLEQWGEGYHAAATPPMPRIASKLPAPEIDALASFLSFVGERRSH